MDVKIHCFARVKRHVKKSKHRVGDECPTVCQVLSLNPHFGVVVPGHSPLRKMRVHLPKQNMGKSGGYRAVYICSVVDETMYCVILELYFKGDKTDLAQEEYEKALTEGQHILLDVLKHPWDDGAFPSGS